MKLGMWNVDRETLRRDGLILFSKLIRTKNVDSLQEQVRPREDDRKQKLTVSFSYFLQVFFLFMFYSSYFANFRNEYYPLD